MLQVALAQLQDQEESRLWAEFAKVGKTETRNKLAEYYQSYVRVIAANIYAKQFVKDIEFDDYMQFGMVGLLEAIDRFDVDRGVNFRTYAGYRIKGAIYTGLVSFSEKRAQGDYRQELWNARIKSLTDETNQVSLFEQLVEITISIALGYIIDNNNVNHSQNPTKSPYENKHFEELGTQINHLITQLPEKEQLIVRYHYYHQVEFQAIGDILQLKKSRISQLHKRALIRLRELLKPAEHLNRFY